MRLASELYVLYSECKPRIPKSADRRDIFLQKESAEQAVNAGGVFHLLILADKFVGALPKGLAITPPSQGLGAAAGA